MQLIRTPRKHEFLIASITGVAGAVTLGLSLGFQHQLPISRQAAKIAGFIVLYCGMALWLWAAVHLRVAIGGMVAPRLERLVVTGPYALVRHPLYLGTAAAMLGVAVITRSLVGIVAVFVLFIPVEIHRAALEENALADKFGDTWRIYALRVGFFLPRVSKR